MFLFTMLRPRKETAVVLTPVETLTVDLVQLIRDTGEDGKLTRDEQNKLTRHFWELVRTVRQESQ